MMPYTGGKEMNFKIRVEKHMGEYKLNKLKIKEDGKFIYNGKELLYKHILPTDKKQLNIIENYREAFCKSNYSKIKYHKYFHHLNSSQAMCINFFYPLIKENGLGLILDIIGLKANIDDSIEEACFEKESDEEEGATRKTNFDFYIRLKSNVKIYFEIKYTENQFGKAKQDKNHKEKFFTIYKQLLEENEAIKEAYKGEEYFLNNYQIMRNVLHIREDRYVVFIYAKENSIISEQAQRAREDVINDKFRRHFILYSWEDMVQQLILSLPNNKLKDYYEIEFTDKYLKY